MQLAGQVALITGGSRGIGRATALAFATEGADIAFCHLDDGAKADETAAEITALGAPRVCTARSTWPTSAPRRTFWPPPSRTASGRSTSCSTTPE